MDEVLLNSSFSLEGDEEHVTDIAQVEVEVRTQHTCSKCEFTTHHISSLKRHDRIHQDEHQDEHQRPEYLCSTCGKTYTSKYGLDLHKKSKHEMIFKHKCPYCPKQYTTLWNYRGHVASHEDAFKERCPECHRSFQYKVSMLRHRQTCHLNPTTITCKECNDVFKSNQTLKEHVKRKHEQQEVKCNKCCKSFKWRSSLHYHNKKYLAVTNN